MIAKDKYAFLISPDINGNIVIDYGRVVYEVREEESRYKAIITYIFDDNSSIKILYTREMDYVLERDNGWNTD